MNRKDFIKTCSVALIGLPFASTLLISCETLYYASSKMSADQNHIIVPLSEFQIVKKDRTIERDFVLIQSANQGFPICLYKTDKNQFTAALMKCTHRGCELNVGGGIYSCPCHGSEFDKRGTVLEGPADQDLKIFETSIKNDEIYIHLS